MQIRKWCTASGQRSWWAHSAHLWPRNVPFTTASIELVEMAQYYCNMNSNFAAWSEILRRAVSNVVCANFREKIHRCIYFNVFWSFNGVFYGSYTSCSQSTWVSIKLGYNTRILQLSTRKIWLSLYETTEKMHNLTWQIAFRQLCHNIAVFQAKRKIPFRKLNTVLTFLKTNILVLIILLFSFL